MSQMASNFPAIPAGDLSIEAVDREIAGGFRLQRFAPALERAYEADRHEDRLRYLQYCLVIGVAIYNSFLFADWQMIPDVVFESAIHRLGMFTPLAVAAYCLVRRHHTAALREGLWSAMGVIAVILMMKTLVDSTSRYVTCYAYGTVLVMIYSLIVQRANIRYAIVSCSLMVAVQIIAIKSSPLFDANMIVANVTFFVSAGALLLWVAYTLEREERRVYLLVLRSRILNERLERIAKVDPLTGLWNRRHLESAMSAAWAEAASRPVSMAVILLDIDQFKPFNDTYGHMEGDVCLQRVAGSLMQALQNERSGVAVRFGGEEFLVFLPGRDEVAACAVAERLRNGVHREAIPHPVLGAQAIVTASFGVAAGPASVTVPTGLIASADKALYRAKADGRDRIRGAGSLEWPGHVARAKAG